MRENPNPSDELSLFAMPAPSARAAASSARARKPRKQPKPVSAGLLLWRPSEDDGEGDVRAGGRSIEVLLAHPGGPFYVEKDVGVWTIPKGLVEPGEEAASAARRELHEETGITLAAADASPPLADLGEAALKSGKRIRAWASPAPVGLPPAGVPLTLPAPSRRNTFAREWPPRSGQWPRFPEIDLAIFLDLVAAAGKIHPVQRVFLDRLEALLMSR